MFNAGNKAHFPELSYVVSTRSSPFQAEGKIGDMDFYFRERHGNVTLDIKEIEVFNCRYATEEMTEPVMVSIVYFWYYNCFSADETNKVLLKALDVMEEYGFKMKKQVSELVSNNHKMCEEKNKLRDKIARYESSPSELST